MSRRRLSTVLITLGLTGVVLAVGALGFIYSGVYNVAATDEHMGVVRWALKTTQVRSVRARREDVPRPPTADSAMLEHGFQHYNSMCVVCHGAPGVERGEFGRGINPTPPDGELFARRYTSRELFWIIKHGLKMAGMPAFGPTHSDSEIWAIVAFVERLPEMSAQEYERRVEQHADARGDEGPGHTH